MDSDTHLLDGGPEGDLALRKARRNCIIMLVLCGVVSISFGSPPVTVSDDGESIGISIGFASLLGVAGGIFAAIYLTFRMRVVLRLSIPLRAAGMLAGAFLIAHSVLAISAQRSGETGGKGLGGDTAIGATGPHRWKVDGRDCDIAGTYYLPMSGGLQYTIVYLLVGEDGLSRMHPDRAMTTAWPLIKHAYENGLYKRAKVTVPGRGEMAVSRIGVALLHGEGKQVSGIHAAMTLDEIKSRIKPTARPAERQPASSAPDE